MNPAPLTPDPLDLVWSPEQRANGREACRAEALAAAEHMIAHDLAGQLPPADVFTAGLIEAWLADHDAQVERVAEIVRSPEAVGHEALARQLALSTKHSAVAVRIMLRGASPSLSVLPTGRDRRQRVEAARRAATMGGGL